MAAFTAEPMLMSAPSQQSAPPPPGPSSISAVPPPCDLFLYAGDDFRMSVNVYNPDGSNFDLSAATATAQIRVAPGDGNILASFAITVTTNVIALHLAHTDSAQLPRSAVWDLQIASPDITTLLAGSVTTTAEVTRP